MDIDKILKNIAKRLRNEKEAVCEVRNTELYTEEPIERQAKAAFRSDLPPQIKEMKAIAENPETMWLARDVMFIKQARFMENYEDSYSEKPAFHHYYPTYMDMTDSQLRYYFTWRTRLRQGEYTKIGASYIFVYIYELLSLVGCNSTEDGFEKLRRLYKFVGEDSTDHDIVLYHLKKWMFDFVIYYNLDPSFLDGINDRDGDTALAVLANRGEFSESDVFCALCDLSSYNIRKSRFFQKYPEDCKAVVARTYDAMCAYSEKHRKMTYFERLFGRQALMPYRIFESAVFRADSRKGYEYRVNSVHSYKTTSTGAWFSKRFYSAGKKNKTVGKLLKAVDRMMREEYGFPHPLAEDDTTKLLSSMIKEQMGLLKEEKLRKERAEIKIDISLLSGIRKSADITRDRLIVEEEIEEEPEETISAIAKELKIEGLDNAECSFLEILLRGEKYKGATPASLLCDSINEKLYDRFSDTVIDFVGDEPQIIEDYREELEEMFK